MIKTFTHNDVIRYAYHETPEEEVEYVEQLLLTDPDMHAFYQDVLTLRHQITLTTLEPSQEVTSRILHYSRHFALK